MFPVCSKPSGQGIKFGLSIHFPGWSEPCQLLVGDSAEEGPCQHPKDVNKSSLIKLLFQHLIRLFLVELEVFLSFFFFFFVKVV